MKERWFRGADRDRDPNQNRFDPIVEGARCGLSRELSLALWERMRVEEADASGRGDIELTQQRFHECAARLAAHGGWLFPEVGRLTRTSVEIDRTVADTWHAHQPSPPRPDRDGLLTIRARIGEKRPHVPGRETLVTLESRRWGQTSEASTLTREDAGVTRAQDRRGAGGIDRTQAANSKIPTVVNERTLRALGGTLFTNGRVPALDVDLTAIEVSPSMAPGHPPRATALPAAVMRSTERDEIDPDAAELVARARRGGALLEDKLRSQLEEALGVRLDSVRVHIGPEADAAARALGARAFAVGDDVVFRDEAYDPHGQDGQRLIAHEVAHTVQARRTSLAGSAAVVSQPGDALEREADAFADTFVRGIYGASGATGVSGTPRPGAPARIERAPRSTGDVTRASAAPTGASSSSATIYRQRAPGGAQVSRGMLNHPGVSPDVAGRYDAFLAGVYAAAQRIVSTNIQAVEAWRNYVLNQMTPWQMGGQVFATGFEQIQQQAVANHAEHLLAPYAHEPNPIRQSLYEHQMSGQWRACTGCHVSNQAWEMDGRMRDAGDPGTTPAELLSRHAGTGFSSGRTRSLDLRIWSDPDAWNTTFAPPPSASIAPPSVTLGSSSRSPADLAREQQASLAAAQQAMAQIRPQLQPLGDSGYKIIPSNVISRFGQAPLRELQTAIEAAFARRLSGYRALMERIRAQSIDYLEFDTLVSLLRPIASPEVRALIDEDMRRRRHTQIFTFVGLLLVDLLAIVVPPLVPVAGALHVVNGAAQMEVGTDRSNATGLHALMSPGQQASGPMMQMAGTLEAIGGAVQVGLSVSGLASRGAGARVVASRTQGELTLEVLENGVVRGTHAGYPGKSIVMNPDGSFQAFDEFGSVVGTGHIGQGGGQAAAAQAWGTSGSGTSTAIARPAPGSSSLAPASRTTSSWPQISPFYTGGSGPGTLPPNQYNPSGRGDNCGFTSMSYVRHQQNPSAPICTADDLYLQRLEQLGFTPNDNLARQLVFPGQNFDGLRSMPGYEPLFNNDGNRLSEYTLTSSAGALGIPGRQANDALRRWRFAFGPHASIDEAVEARVAFLEEDHGRSVDPTAVRRLIEAQRADLPGLYIVGSHESAHYMTITIEQNGRITGFDPQNGRQYPTLESVLNRMGSEGFDLMYKVTMPPAGETR